MVSKASRHSSQHNALPEARTDDAQAHCAYSVQSVAHGMGYTVCVCRLVLELLYSTSVVTGLDTDTVVVTSAI